MKKNKGILVIVVVLVLAAIVAAVFLLGGKDKSELNTYANNTEISSANGYRLDLRLTGTYGKQRIHETIMINNYKNTDKTISVTKVNDGKDEKKEYVFKDGKYYEVNDNKLTEVENVLYSETDIFLLGVKNIKDVKQDKDQTISDTTYKVYTGTVKKDIINKMLKYTDLGFEVEEDASAEVWLTKDNHVYKAYYRIGDFEIYPSYFAYGNTNTINLDMYNGNNNNAKPAEKK